MTAAGTRARVRAELTREIAEAARRHLATQGAAGLSLRAVARELGMASSAVYRYFPSRDDLLTALIVDAYNAIGASAEQAEARVDRTDLRARWGAVCHAARAWAVAHPHEYALVYGSPVPGYAAPEATIGPASRVGALLTRVVSDGVTAGLIDPAPDGPTAGDVLSPGVAEMLELPPTIAPRVVMAWSGLYGAISFEIFGQTHKVVADHETYFEATTNRLAMLIPLP
jgi:AcrR family transcriptional regulator